jgi:hypothetical protein
VEPDWKAGVQQGQGIEQAIAVMMEDHLLAAVHPDPLCRQANSAGTPHRYRYSRS